MSNERRLTRTSKRQVLRITQREEQKAASVGHTTVETVRGYLLGDPNQKQSSIWAVEKGLKAIKREDLLHVKVLEPPPPALLPLPPLPPIPPPTAPVSKSVLEPKRDPEELAVEGGIIHPRTPQAAGPPGFIDSLKMHGALQEAIRAGMVGQRIAKEGEHIHVTILVEVRYSESK